MVKTDKLILRLKSKPKDFTYQELSKLLKSFNYDELNQGKSSGSRVAWLNSKTKHLIRLHKPHPGNIIKSYQINQLIEELEKEGLI